MEIVLTDYRVFLQSARSEFDSMIRVQNARAISRIGFVAQDMKNFESDVANAIEDRALEINNSNAECIVEAELNLQSAAVTGGNVIMYSAQQWSALNDYLIEGYIHVTTDELHFIISLFEFELFNLFSHVNSVTNMFDLLLTYQTDVQVFFNIFEYFVYYVFLDMYIYDLTTNQENVNMFQVLNEGLQEFRTACDIILASLADCHE